MRAKSLQSCLTLCDPMDCSPPGSSVPGILQARILEWGAMPSSKGISQTQGSSPHLLHLLRRQAGFSPLAPPGKYLKLRICDWWYWYNFLDRYTELYATEVTKHRQCNNIPWMEFLLNHSLSISVEGWHQGKNWQPDVTAHGMEIKIHTAMESYPS